MAVTDRTNNIIFARPNDNVAVNATPTIQTGTAATDYPAGLLIDFTDVNRGFPSLLVETSGAWLLDFGSAQSLEGAVIWHNFDAGSTVKLQGNATNSWGTPSLDQTILIPNKRANSYTIKIFADLRTAAPSYRYYRLVISSTNSVPVGAKIMLLATLRQPLDNIKWGMAETEVHSGILHRTDAKYSWGYDLMSYARTLKGEATAWSDTDRDVIRGFFRSLAGVAGIGAVISRPDQNEAMIGRWYSGQLSGGGPVDVQLETHYNFRNQNQVLSIDFIEEFSGDPEWT